MFLILSSSLLCLPYAQTANDTTLATVTIKAAEDYTTPATATLTIKTIKTAEDSNAAAKIIPATATAIDTVNVKVMPISSSPAMEYIAENGGLTRESSFLIFSGAHCYLDPSDVDSVTWNNYQNAKNMCAWGQSIWGICAGVVAGDLLANLIINDRVLDEYGIVIGGVGLLIGVPLDFIGRHKLNRIAAQYNSEHSTVKKTHIELAPASTGLGLSLIF